MTTSYVDVNGQLANIAQIVRGAPGDTLRRAYMRSVRDFCAQTHYVRESVAGATVADTRRYALGDDPILEIVGIMAMSVSQTVGGRVEALSVGPSDASSWDPNASTGMPRRYQYIPQAQFALDVVPDAVYNLTITVSVQPKETANQIPVAVLTKYSNEIEAGALAYLHAISGMPWSSPTRAVECRREFQSGVNNARADVQRSFNVGSVRVRPRSFGAGFSR